MYVHAMHIVHAVPDLRIAAGRFAGRFIAYLNAYFVRLESSSTEARVSFKARLRYLKVSARSLESYHSSSSKSFSTAIKSSGLTFKPVFRDSSESLEIIVLSSSFLSIDTR